MKTLHKKVFRFSGLLTIFVFISMSLGLTTYAASQLNLNQATEEAELNSPSYQSMKAAAEGAKWRRVESYSSFLPSLSVQALRILDYKYQTFDVSLGGPTLAFPEILPNTAATLNAYLPLFDGFANLNHYRASSSFETAATHDLNWAHFQLAQQVKLKFYEALAAKKLADVAKQNVKTLDDHLQKTQVQKRGGVSTQFDVLRIEVQLSDAKAEEILTSDNVEISKKALTEAMGLDTDSRDVTGDLPNPEGRLVENLQVPTPESREDVRALLSRDEATSQIVKTASVFWVPKIGLSYQYSYYNNRDNTLIDASNYRNAWELGLSLTWNLFDGMASIARSHEADAEYVKSQKLVRQAMLHIPVEFDKWKKRFVTASVNYKAKVLNVTRAQESVRLAQEGYRAGTRINSEVLDAELDLFRARAGVFSTQLSAEQALINLESVVGRKIESEK